MQIQERWMSMKKFFALVSVVLVSGAFVWANGQAVPSLDSMKSQEELTRAITALDKQLFDAYNTCNIEKLGTFVTDDLEFYHDKTGLAVGKQPFLDAIKKNICGKVTRELIPGSLEVYPLHGYGAVEIGVHRFHHPGTQDSDVVGEAKFVHLWQYKDGAWKISRVISYDHDAAK
jgi:ketosteroid isomerase-like protein